MTKQAWFCPACQKHHAPHVETCPAPADAVSDKSFVAPGTIPSIFGPSRAPWPVTPPRPYEAISLGVINKRAPDYKIQN